MMGCMDSRAALDQSLAELARLLPSVRSDAWPRPTPCPAWSVADVFDHVLTITDKFTRFAAGWTDAPRGRVVHPLDRCAALVTAIFQSRAAWSEVDLRRVCRLPFGDFPAQEAAAINAADVLVHTWDIARGAGLDYSIPDDLVPGALATIRSLTSGEAIGAGHYGLPPAAADSGGTHAVLLASGRSPAWPDE